MNKTVVIIIAVVSMLVIAGVIVFFVFRKPDIGDCKYWSGYFKCTDSNGNNIDSKTGKNSDCGKKGGKWTHCLSDQL
jgi:hypothetical protein